MSDVKIIDGRLCEVSRNESFIRTAEELKRRGIKNWNFMLEINNPEIADVDPFNNDMSLHTRRALMKEYTHNLWWFLRTAVDIRMDRGLAAVCYNILHDQSCYLCAPRQLSHKTTNIINGPLLWLHTFFPKQMFCTNMNIGLYSPSKDNSVDLMKSMADAAMKLPIERDMVKYPVSPTCERMINHVTGSVVTARPAPSSIDQSHAIGRGGCENIQFFDSVEHIKFIDDILEYGTPAFVATRKNALYHSRIMAGTPNNSRETPFIANMIPWTEKIYDMSSYEVSSYKNCFYGAIDVFYIEYHYQDLDIDSDKVADYRTIMDNDENFRSEILLQR